MKMYILKERLSDEIEDKIRDIIRYPSEKYLVDITGRITHVTWSVIQMFNLFDKISLNDMEDVSNPAVEKMERVMSQGGIVHQDEQIICSEAMADTLVKLGVWPKDYLESLKRQNILYTVKGNDK